MADEPLHEIQLNGKQLVFLFMSATVVAVVIFLAGVMVGRGIQTPRADAVEASADGSIDPTAPPPSSSASGPESAPATARETLTYADRLEGSTPAEETLNDPTAPVSAPPPPVREPAAAPTAAPAVAAVATPVPTPPKPTATRAPAAAPVAASTEPAGTGFVVQVAATKVRAEADSIAKRLTGKGYPAFVTSPASGPVMYRVRVGKYKERREAETIASRLEREEQFKPWVTR